MYLLPRLPGDSHSQTALASPFWSVAGSPPSRAAGEITDIHFLTRMCHINLTGKTGSPNVSKIIIISSTGKPDSLFNPPSSQHIPLQDNRPPRPRHSDGVCHTCCEQVQCIMLFQHTEEQNTRSPPPSPQSENTCQIIDGNSVIHDSFGVS